jgi:hypothetical protein
MISLKRWREQDGFSQSDALKVLNNMASTLGLHGTTAAPDPRLVEQATFYIVGSVP